MPSGRRKDDVLSFICFGQCVWGQGVHCEQVAALHGPLRGVLKKMDRMN